mmetsp:Transcript_51028/g.100303  ORF Transcript_51028/g.100303 Transcript_51028/m.100303 type:complete len:114 (+) Transcript_51028:667-1008(+)
MKEQPHYPSMNGSSSAPEGEEQTGIRCFFFSVWLFLYVMRRGVGWIDHGVFLTGDHCLGSGYFFACQAASSNEEKKEELPFPVFSPSLYGKTRRQKKKRTPETGFLLNCNASR